MGKAPCYGCKEKIPPDCHSWCKRYKDFRAEKDAVNEKKRRENMISHDVIEVHRTKMRSRNRGMENRMRGK